MSCGQRRTEFILAQATLASCLLVPEIRLYLATDARSIFQAAHDPDCGWPPYWAFAWPGGQALARYILDNPSIVSGRTVIDIGAGSGIAAIAAAMSGAAQVSAVDPDPQASTAIAMNAMANGVPIAPVMEDILGNEPHADVIFIADLVYEPELATRVARFLEWARGNGATVFMADRTTARRPPVELEFLARYHAPLTPMLDESQFEDANVWRLETASQPSAPARRT